MPWLEIHQELPHHPKTHDLMAALDVSAAQAVGMLTMGWLWALSFTKDGFIPENRLKSAARGAGWEADPCDFADAMVQAGYWDSEKAGWQIHDWKDYAGRLIEQRRHHAENKRRARDLFDNHDLIKLIRQRDGDACRYCGIAVNFRDRKGATGGTYDHVDPDGGNSFDNVVVACRACNAGKGRRTPEQARMALRQISSDAGRFSTGDSPGRANSSALHDQTVHDQTKQITPGARAREEGSEESPCLRPAPKPRSEYPADFESFWAAYPERRRVKKKAAGDLFKRALAGGAPVDEIMAGLQRWKLSKDWLKDGGEYVCQPDVWLRNRCWEDNPEPARTTSTGNPIGAVPDVPSPYAGKAWAPIWSSAAKGTFSDQQYLETQARRAFDKGGTCDVHRAMTLFKTDGVVAAMDYVWSHDPRNPVRAHVAAH